VLEHGLRVVGLPVGGGLRAGGLGAVPLIRRASACSTPSLVTQPSSWRESGDTTGSPSRP